MGMTVDKAIPKIQFVRNALNDDMEIAKAYDLAMTTMRKYQKIGEVYKKYLNDMVTNIYADGKFIKALREVLDDYNSN